MSVRANPPPRTEQTIYTYSLRFASETFSAAFFSACNNSWIPSFLETTEAIN